MGQRAKAWTGGHAEPKSEAEELQAEARTRTRRLWGDFVSLLNRRDRAAVLLRDATTRPPKSAAGRAAWTRELLCSRTRSPGSTTK